VWDFTCSDASSPVIYISFPCRQISLHVLLNRKKSWNTRNLLTLASAISFPLSSASWTLGGSSVNAFLAEIGARIARKIGDPRSFAFFKQKLSLAQPPEGSLVQSIGFHSLRSCPQLILDPRHWVLLLCSILALLFFVYSF